MTMIETILTALAILLGAVAGLTQKKSDTDCGSGAKLAEGLSLKPCLHQ